MCNLANACEGQKAVNRRNDQFRFAAKHLAGRVMLGIGICAVVVSNGFAESISTKPTKVLVDVVSIDSTQGVAWVNRITPLGNQSMSNRSGNVVESLSPVATQSQPVSDEKTKKTTTDAKRADKAGVCPNEVTKFDKELNDHWFRWMMLGFAICFVAMYCIAFLGAFLIFTLRYGWSEAWGAVKFGLWEWGLWP